MSVLLFASPHGTRVVEPNGDHQEAREVVELDRAVAMRLLESAPYGRVVFTRDALPAIRPVTHIVEDGKIIMRTRVTARLTPSVRAESDIVVAYQTDDIDPVEHLGWSVVVTGFARTVADPARIAHYEQLLPSWGDRLMDTVIAIEPTVVTGIRLVAKEYAKEYVARDR